MMPGMMNDEDKKIAAVIVGSPSKEEPKEMVALDAASEEVLAAIESKDKKAFKDALESFIYLCGEKNPGNPGKEEYPEE